MLFRSVKIADLASECEKYIFPVGYKFALEARGFAMQAFRQNVVEYMGGDDYGEGRRRIHGLVKELLAMADERKISDRDQNRKWA